jgi:predicted TPR repeat methyltransferase
MASHDETSAIVEKGYDTIADKYLAWSAPRPTTTRAEYISKLGQLLPKGAKVLELGCGDGVPATQQLVACGLDVTGVDISGAQVELARKHVPEATFIRGDMLSLRYEPSSFDAVVAFYSIFHLPKEEQGKMVFMIVTWLKEGGYLLFNLGTEEGDVRRDDWMGAEMFSSGLGIDGNRKMTGEALQGMTILEDNLDEELVGRVKAGFHWFFAVKKD